MLFISANVDKRFSFENVCFIIINYKIVAVCERIDKERNIIIAVDDDDGDGDGYSFGYNNRYLGVIINRKHYF